MGSKKIHIFALAAHGQGISGGDRIFIEFARYWAKNLPVTIYVWEEGYEMCQRLGLNISNISKASLLQMAELKYQISNMKPWKNFGFIINYFARIIEGIRIGLIIKVENSSNTIIYSASEFWMDSLPALLLKLRYKNIKWIAAWYQTSPNPFIGFSEGNREARGHRVRSFLYWIVQLPIKPLINKFADFVLVNNELEKIQFPRLNKLSRVIVVYGAIDLQKINQFKKFHQNFSKVYMAVFQGRFHPQKGVLELIDIWKQVVNKKPHAKLVMIGDGPLMKNLKFKISNLKLEKNVILTGYLFDSPKKYRIFSQSKIVVHPAVFDSGGMASFEAMAFGLPCVGFNLLSYKYYYPKGMIKIKSGDLQSFSDKVLELISNKKLYQKIAKEAFDLVAYDHSWEDRSRQVLQQVLK